MNHQSKLDMIAEAIVDYSDYINNRTSLLKDKLLQYGFCYYFRHGRGISGDTILLLLEEFKPKGNSDIVYWSDVSYWFPTGLKGAEQRLSLLIEAHKYYSVHNTSI